MTAQGTGLIFDERYLLHDTGTQTTVQMRGGSFTLAPEPHPSSTSITRRIKQFLDGSGLTAMMQPIAARSATEDELTVYHTREYIAGVRAHVAGGPAHGAWGEIESDTPLSAGSFEAAVYAAGGAMNAVQAVMESRVRNAYALLRPPGHHAMSNRGMGFCVFNNAVIAAHYARKTYGLERILIVDWDVHHGNGTQDIFYADGGVEFFSIHRYPFYPGTGAADETGTGHGLGRILNVPIRYGTPRQEYRSAFASALEKAADAIKPELVLLSAGFDAHAADPIGSLGLEVEDFAEMTKRVLDVARTHAGGRLVSCLEGGYDLAALAASVQAHLEELLGAAG